MADLLFCQCVGSDGKSMQHMSSQFMLTLHCSLLIFMQMFQLQCVSIKPCTVSCIEIKFIWSCCPSPSSSETTHPDTFPNTRADWLTNGLIKIYSKSYFGVLDVRSLWRPPAMLFDAVDIAHGGQRRHSCWVLVVKLTKESLVCPQTQTIEREAGF